MTTSRIPVLATSFATCMVLMIAFLACVLFWAVFYLPAMHLILPHVLVGFPVITATGILVGLIGSLVVGNVLGATFAVSFNWLERCFQAVPAWCGRNHLNPSSLEIG